MKPAAKKSTRLSNLEHLEATYQRHFMARKQSFTANDIVNAFFSDKNPTKREYERVRHQIYKLFPYLEGKGLIRFVGEKDMESNLKGKKKVYEWVGGST